MNKFNKNLPYRKINALLRASYATFLPSSLSLIVNEFPRSGGTWFCQLLSSATGIPMPELLPNIFAKRQILHGHFYYASPQRLKKSILIIRNPKDVLVSLYFHVTRENDIGNRALVRRLREKNIAQSSLFEESFAEFISYMSGKTVLGYSYIEFMRKFSFSTDTIIKYEDLYDDPYEVVCKTVSELKLDVDHEKLRLKIAETNLKTSSKSSSFRESPSDYSSQTSTNLPASMPFVRSGGYGKWVKYFSDDALSIYELHFGSLARDLGYDE